MDMDTSAVTQPVADRMRGVSLPSGDLLVALEPELAALQRFALPLTGDSHKAREGCIVGLDRYRVGRAGWPRRPRGAGRRGCVLAGNGQTPVWTGKEALVLGGASGIGGLAFTPSP
jgi:hypothetical protein